MEVANILFNHKPFIQKELNYFINAFESTLIKKEVAFDELENCTKNLCDETLPSSLAILNNNMEKLNLKGIGAIS